MEKLLGWSADLERVVLGAQDIGEVGRVGQLAAQHLVIRDLVVVDDGRDVALTVLLELVAGRSVGQDLVVRSPRLEIVPVADPGQVHRRDRLGGVGVQHIVVAGERAVGRHRAIPAERPILIDEELARRPKTATQRAVAIGAGEGVGIHLVDAGGADGVGAMHEAMPPFDVGE